MGIHKFYDNKTEFRSPETLDSTHLRLANNCLLTVFWAQGHRW